MYDGCIVPLFDTFGINNPCPDNEQKKVLSQRILNEAEEQANISADMSEAMIEWIDECGADQDCYEVGTGWSFIWAWNASWCIIAGFNFFFFAFGSCYWWPRFLGTLINIFLSCCQLSGAVFMLTGVYNPFSRVCQYNLATSTYDGDYKWNWTGSTFNDDFSLMLGMGVTLSVFWLIQVTICCLPLCLTPIEGKQERSIMSRAYQEDKRRRMQSMKMAKLELEDLREQELKE